MRTLRSLILLGVCALLASGCGDADKSKDKRNAENAPAEDRTAAMLERLEARGGSKKSGGDMMKGAAKDKDKAAPPAAGGGAFGKGDIVAESPRPREAMAEEAMAGGKHEAPLQPPEAPKPEPQSGLLTAGSFDDNLTPRFYQKFVRSMQQSRELGSLPQRFLGQRLLVAVRNQEGKPVGNCRVHVAPAAGGNGVELISRSDGTAVCLTSWDGINADGDLTVTVTPPDRSAPVKETVRKGLDRWDVKLAAAAPLPANLDLCICLDTTGSMGAELAFLISEVKAIATAIHDKFPNVRTHYGLVVYKDFGDEYVAKRFDFTTDLDEFRRHLGEQRAAGGGDIPEAVQEGFAEAVKLQWRDKDTTRVMFHIADAPPHTQDIERTLNLADQLRKKGVVIYPVACKNYDDPCEFVMRSSALLSGGQFLFLTDDSGVGGKHDEPHIPYYKVQRLEQLMIRMVASELAGRRIEPEPQQVLRVVGKPVN